MIRLAISMEKYKLFSYMCLISVKLSKYIDIKSFFDGGGEIRELRNWGKFLSSLTLTGPEDAVRLEFANSRRHFL